MKPLIKLLLSAGSIFGAIAISAVDGDQALMSRLATALAKVPGLLAQDPTGAKAHRYINQQNLADDIAGYIFASGGDFGNPTPELRRRLAFVEDQLAKYQDVVAEVLRAPTSNSDNYEDVETLLGYAKPTPQLKATLSEIIAPASTAGELAQEQAYEVIFELRLDDPELRADVVQRIRDSYDPRKVTAIGAYLRNRAEDWGMPEMEVLYKEWLSIPYDVANQQAFGGMQTLLSDYGRAAGGLEYFGGLGASYLDLLKKRKAELEQGPEKAPGAAAELNEAIDIIEGRRPPRFASNLKGQYMGISKRLSHDLQFGGNGIKESKDVSKGSSTDQTTRDSSEVGHLSIAQRYLNFDSRKIWAVCAGLFSIGLMVIWLLRGRSKH